VCFKALYRFKEDEVGCILNMKTKWSAPVRPAVDVEADFRVKLHTLLERFTCDGSRNVDYERLALADDFKELVASCAELQVCYRECEREIECVRVCVC
jgi:hypothetical protein